MIPSRWPIIMVSGLCSMFGLFYGFAQLQPPPVVGFGVAALPFFTCAWWVQRDAAARRISFPLDWGAFAWAGWPVLIPWYAWRTRQTGRGRLTIALYCAILSPYLFVAIGVILAKVVGVYHDGA